LSDGALEACRKIDADKDGSISALELVSAARKDPQLAVLLLPGATAAVLSDEEEMVDAVDSLFEAIASGRKRITYADLADHLSGSGAQTLANEEEIRSVYGMIGADADGTVSRWALFDAVRRHERVARQLLPDADPARSDEDTFDEVQRAFEQLGEGRARLALADFLRHLGRPAPAASQAAARPGQDRASKRLLAVSAGLGRGADLQKALMVEKAGFQVHWTVPLPCPDGAAGFDMQPHLRGLKETIDRVQPDVVLCASFGGAYVARLWETGLWAGPTVMINVHPSCGRLPQGVPVVLAHGGNDASYPASRESLEALAASASPNHCFLLYSGDSGQLGTGQKSRVGDGHRMDSLLLHDCLPRLIDAALGADGPELHFMRTWRERLTTERLEAERSLGLTPEELRRFWASPGRKGLGDRRLFQVSAGGEEFQWVCRLFQALPLERQTYQLSPEEAWAQVRIVDVQRVENGLQLEGSTKPYHDALCRALQDQGVGLEPGVHTCWAFHGCGADASVMDSIVGNPIAGFQPLASGSRGASLWGTGTYFAREAKYVVDGGFCGAPGAGGSRRVLLCLLQLGTPCLGDPRHRGVLPLRPAVAPHRYSSSVDSLSSPEIFITQHHGAAHPAYVITFR